MTIEVLDLWPPAAEVVRRLGGRAHSSDILRYTTRHQITVALQRGRLVRAARGVYVLPHLPSQQLVAARCRGVVSHQSAAERRGLEMVFPPRSVHVTAPRGAKPPFIRGVVVHRCDLDDADVSDGTTTLLRTVLDCAATMPFREALAIADSAARIVPDFVEELADAAAQRRGRGRGRCLRVARAASALPENPFESALRGSLIAAGIRGFEPQVTIRTATGEVRVDLADVQRRIVIEADSFTWHGSRRALAADCRRYAELVRQGWTVLRFAWEHVMFEDEWLVAVVADVCAGRLAA